jgi:hypothetical protein
VHDDGAREVVELGAEQSTSISLHAEVAVPGDALEERIHQAHQQREASSCG